MISERRERNPNSEVGPEGLVSDLPCQVHAEHAVLRITTRRLVILSATGMSREIWTCRLQDLTQVLRIGSGGTVSVVLVTRTPAVAGLVARFDALFDVTGRFPSVSLAAQLAPKIGALVLDQLQGATDPGQHKKDDPPGLPFVPGAYEELVRHFHLGDSLDVWVTTSRLIFHRGTRAHVARGRSVPAIVTSDRLVMTEELPLALTWEVNLSDISGLDQQDFNTSGVSLRYILPVTDSRGGDVSSVAMSSVWGSGFFERRDRSNSAEYWAWRRRHGEFKAMTGPPRGAAAAGDNAQWFWLLSLPATGPDGDSLWSELGPLLASLYSGDVVPSASDRASARAFTPLGEVVKQFEVPSPTDGPNHASKLIISRRGLTLWRETKMGSFSVQSVWHLFTRPGTRPRVMLNRVAVATARKRDLRAGCWLVVAAPFALFVSLLFVPFALAVPCTVLVSLLFLLFVLRPKPRPGRESPAIGIASANREPSISTANPFEGSDEEAEAGRLNETPSVNVGVPTPPALLVQEEAGRLIVLEANEILSRLYQGKI